MKVKKLNHQFKNIDIPSVYPRISEKDSQVMTRLAFHLSQNLLELYFRLLKDDELSLSVKMLNSGIAIREKMDNAFADLRTEGYTGYISEAFEKACETRYWIQLLQKKYDKNDGMDPIVEKLNKLLAMLNHCVEKDKERLNIPLPLLN